MKIRSIHRENTQNPSIFSVGLACFSFEADVVAIVQAADEPFNLFSDGSRCFLLRPLIGIITKVDSPYANLPMVRQWMQNSGM